MSLLHSLRFILNHPLNRHQKVKTLQRYLSWQVGSRMIGAPMVMPWVNGSRMIVARGQRGLTGNVYCGLHEFNDMAFVLHMLTDKDLFVDVGANAGSYTILAGAGCGAHVVSVEPLPQTFQSLADNVNINHMTNTVSLHNVGVADAEGTLKFTKNYDTMNHVATEDDKDTLNVPVVTLDGLLDGQAPIMLKVDVEGFEPAVLKGAVATLANQQLKAVLIEENGNDVRYGHDGESITETMAKNGFAPFTYDPFTRTLQARGPVEVPHGNTLFIRDADEVQIRLNKAAPIHLHGLSF